MNFHAKSGACGSKNGWVIALGMKEDISGVGGGGRGAQFLQLIIQSKLCCSKFKVWTIKFEKIWTTVLRLLIESGPNNTFIRNVE